MMTLLMVKCLWVLETQMDRTTGRMMRSEVNFVSTGETDG